jgi:hypothetical protein
LSRLAPLDKALILILVPLWAACFALSLRSVLSQAGFSPIVVTLSEGQRR